MSPRRNKASSDVIKRCAIICGSVYAVLGFFVRICTKSPYNTVHILEADAYLPAIWLFNFLCIFWFFVCGIASGSIFGRMLCGRISGREEIFLYRGGLFFVSMFFLSLIWYPLFFGGEAIALSLLIIFLCVICSAMCALSWRGISVFSCIIMIANSLWLFYILLVNLLVILHN